VKINREIGHRLVPQKQAHWVTSCIRTITPPAENLVELRGERLERGGGGSLSLPLAGSPQMSSSRQMVLR